MTHLDVVRRVGEIIWIGKDNLIVERTIWIVGRVIWIVEKIIWILKMIIQVVEKLTWVR